MEQGETLFHTRHPAIAPTTLHQESANSALLRNLEWRFRKLKTAFPSILGVVARI